MQGHGEILVHFLSSTKKYKCLVRWRHNNNQQQKFYNKLRLLRNHGLVDRDTVKISGYNSRLDTFQAIVGNWLLPKAKYIARKRIENAKYFDRELSLIPEISIPLRPKNYKLVYHLYVIFVKNRDKLLKHCIKKELKLKSTILNLCIYKRV